MKKRIFAVLLALTLVIGLIPIYSAQVKATDTQKIDITSAVGLEGVTWASGYDMDKLYDGNITTGKYFIGATYATEAGPEGGAYVELTLEKTSLVSEVDLYTRIADGKNAGCPKEFTISAYTGSGWTTVATGSDADLESYASGVGLIKVNFEPVVCNKVKITITKLGQDGNAYCIRMNEIEVYGTENVDTRVNAALSGTVEMECPEWAQKSFGPGKLVDGITTAGNLATTSGSADVAVQKDVKIIFKDGAHEINQINLVPAKQTSSEKTCFPVDFTVSVWNGQTWVQVATKTGYASDGSIVSLTFNKVVCNGILIECTKLSTADDGKYVLMMSEVEALGTKSSASLAAPQDKKDENEEEQPPLDTRVNAALSGTVEMECPEWAQKSYGPGKLVDGITTAGNLATTSGSAAAAVQKDVKIIFKNGAHEINQINLIPAKQTSSEKTCFPVDFTVSVWNGQKWVQVAAKTGYTSDGSIVSLTFNKVVCNGILIECTKLSTADDGKYVLMMSEVEALGTKSSASLAAPQDKKDEGQQSSDTRVNAALNGTVEMECPEWAQKSFGPEKLVDGKAPAGYLATTDASDTATVQKDVKIIFKDGAYEINQINLVPAKPNGTDKNGFPQDFTVSVWNGQKWVQVASKTGYKDNGKTLILTFDKVLCNAIKLTATKLGAIEDGKYALRMAEIEAYGVKSFASISKPPVSSGTTSVGSAPEVTIDNTKNIALHCPTSVIHDHSRWGAGVTNINDGDLKTFMATDDTLYEKGDVLWAEINLLRNYSIDTVILQARNKTEGLPYDFTISIFYDGEWIEAVTKKDFAVDAQAAAYEIKFPAVIGNKIRISTDNFRQTGDKKNSFCLCELAVYGTPVKGNYVLPNENVVSGNTIFTATSSLEDSGYFIKHLYDRDLTTEWSSIPTATAEEEQVLELDFRNTLQVGEVLLKPSWKGSGFPVDFTISVMENEKWVEVYTATDYKKPVDEAIQKFSFEPREISKIRITVTKQAAEGGVYVFKLDEVMAYPYATGDDFDLDAVEEVTATKSYVSAEKNEVATETITVTWWKLIVGVAFVLVAIVGCVTMMLVTKRKN